MGRGWLNALSLVLGLAAWALPLLAFRPGRRQKAWALSLASLVCCALALVFQLMYGQGYVRGGDWSALMDTVDAVVFAAQALVLGTVGLNLAVYLVWRCRP